QWSPKLQAHLERVFLAYKILVKRKCLIKHG
ncbi:MAG: hypothetical protein ACI8ZA_002654, partial [Gammaproteobacteria bacterium]